jgi:hypothetical protein
VFPSVLSLGSTSSAPSRPGLFAGDAWLEGSRRYANPESYLIPPVRWPDLRPEVCALTQTPEDGAARLRERQVELEMLLRRLDDELPHQYFMITLIYSQQTKSKF